MSYNQLLGGIRAAEKIIADTKRKKLTYINLSSLSLTEVPESIQELTNLQQVFLSRNKLKKFPNVICNFVNLRHLYISHNALAEIDEDISRLVKLEQLDISFNYMKALPSGISKLKHIEFLNICGNNFHTIPNDVFELNSLEELYIDGNGIAIVDNSISKLTNLKILTLNNNKINYLPESIASLNNLLDLQISQNNISDLPRLPNISNLHVKLDGNPLSPELKAAYGDSNDAFKRYLEYEKTRLFEAKLILVGEGEVGKSCLLDALIGNPWQEHDSTHGIEIRTVPVVDPINKKEILLNGWDFGGQRVYRPTHQLFFSAQAVYMVIWKPREGPQQGFVKDWIYLIKYREPDAKIFVVATHGGPGQRQPDLDRQELWDIFGKDTIIDFFFVDSKPDEYGKRRGIEQLKDAIAIAASNLPGMGRTVPESWQKTRQHLKNIGDAYLPLKHVKEICSTSGMNAVATNDFITIYHKLGHLIHYEHDESLQDLVILKPDWIATALSFALDDELTRNNQGLIEFTRLNYLWNDPARKPEDRYPEHLHAIFLRLLERFDLSYRIAETEENKNISLIAQLVPDVRPDISSGWNEKSIEFNRSQKQICRIVEIQKNQSATAEGLFYLLIVRLHKYSLGKTNYEKSIHWQRGIILDDDYNGIAFLEHKGNDIHITVRAPYPERFLSVLTYEVKWLVENFWEGLRCDIMVGCVNPCGLNAAGTALFDVQKLIKSKKKGQNESQCNVHYCDGWQDIDCLLRNSVESNRKTPDEIINELLTIKNDIKIVRDLITSLDHSFDNRFDSLDASSQQLLSKIDEAYFGLIKSLNDEAREGPRLISIVPLNKTKFNPINWTRDRFVLTLWCEHSRLPLPVISGESQTGVYEFVFQKKWLRKVTPYLKLVSTTLSFVLPIVASGSKLIINKTAYKKIEDNLEFGQKTLESTLKAFDPILKTRNSYDSFFYENPEIENYGESSYTNESLLRELHAVLKKRDPSFGGLIRVQNKRNEYLWVHPKFAGEY